MIDSLIIILKVLGLSYLITKFEPIEWGFDLLYPKFGKSFVFNILYLASSCFKCCSFWVGLIMGGIWIGIISFIISFVYIKCCSEWETKIKF